VWGPFGMSYLQMRCLYCRLARTPAEHPQIIPKQKPYEVHAKQRPRIGNTQAALSKACPPLNLQTVIPFIHHPSPHYYLSTILLPQLLPHSSRVQLPQLRLPKCTTAIPLRRTPQQYILSQHALHRQEHPSQGRLIFSLLFRLLKSSFLCQGCFFNLPCDFPFSLPCSEKREGLLFGV
jgi:hypothetical protein